MTSSPRSVQPTAVFQSSATAATKATKGMMVMASIVPFCFHPTLESGVKSGGRSTGGAAVVVCTVLVLSLSLSAHLSLVLAFCRLVVGQGLGGVSVAECGMGGQYLLPSIGFDAELLDQGCNQAAHLHVAEAGQRADPLGQVLAAGCVVPHARAIAVVLLGH